MSRKYKFHNKETIDWKYRRTKNYADDNTVLKIDNENMHLGML